MSSAITMSSPFGWFGLPGISYCYNVHAITYTARGHNRQLLLYDVVMCIH